MELIKQQFAANLAMGMTQTAAARAAGIPVGQAKKTMEMPEVQQQICDAQQHISKQLLISREQVLQGLLDVVEDATLQAELMPRVAAWREIGKIAGVYAPEERKVTYDGDVTIMRKQVQVLADEKLHEYTLIEGKVVE